MKPLLLFCILMMGCQWKERRTEKFSFAGNTFSSKTDTLTTRKFIEFTVSTNADTFAIFYKRLVLCPICNKESVLSDKCIPTTYYCENKHWWTFGHENQKPCTGAK